MPHLSEEAGLSKIEDGPTHKNNKEKEKKERNREVGSGKMSRPLGREGAREGGSENAPDLCLHARPVLFHLLYFST